MSKITFRAEDELVDELEDLELSKSEAMREALRSYLDSSDSAASDTPDSSENAERDGAAIDDLVRERVDEVLAERFERLTPSGERDREPAPRGRGPRFGFHPSGWGGGHATPHRSRAPAPESDARDVNITISLEGDGVRTASGSSEGDGDRVAEPNSEPSRETDGRTRAPGRDPDRSRDDAGTTCGQCGESVDDDHVYCPNCGEKASRRLFCDCGDELRSDWAFCPSCGRRTPSADVLESG
ncbi:CopG family transcriptional regulator [Halobiforma lacisalsi AJ5]|uniref:CopG family transcriptional regulator n=1 Tax=Natronobacterium lacisalsi AJ5 TaxID=358396 RepID=M0L4R1_NATLA|nr:zinc ribbon domain-containing protein [Halobiforma lacisalsi]APW97976.1 CopG family transcriptional regulator [Halobiforma lacisalsi AJ5]EMA28531.1 CopG family transcriptional regulator [Halobiforma lacisalsi AJ5]